MSARAALAALIAPHAPAEWDIIDHPTGLRSFDDPAKSVAVVIEQRTVTATRFPDNPEARPVDLSLLVWVVVDATRGDDLGQVEDDLEAALEQLLIILESTELPDHVWDGSAERDEYNPQMPAYKIAIAATGTLTPAPTGNPTEEN